MSELVRTELERGVGHLQLNRPDRRNALSLDLIDALSDALERLVASQASVVILGGEGAAFSAGMDLRRVALDDPQVAARFASGLGRVYEQLLTLPAPLLCAVDGPAFGGGAGLAAAADLVFVGQAAVFSLPETRLGLVPALVSVVLRRRMTPLKLAALLLGGEPLNPDKALAAGLADVAVEGSALAAARAHAARLIAEHSPKALARTKRFLAKSSCDSLATELDAAKTEFCAAVATDSARRGLEAFRQKRSPDWNQEIHHRD